MNQTECEDRALTMVRHYERGLLTYEELMYATDDVHGVWYSIGITDSADCIRIAELNAMLLDVDRNAEVEHCRAFRAQYAAEQAAMATDMKSWAFPLDF